LSFSKNKELHPGSNLIKRLSYKSVGVRQRNVRSCIPNLNSNVRDGISQGLNEMPYKIGLWLNNTQGKKVQTKLKKKNMNNLKKICQ